MLALPVIDFHQRLQVTQSGSKSALELRVSSVHGLQVYERLALVRANQEHWSFGFQALARTFGVRPNIQVPATA